MGASWRSGAKIKEKNKGGERMIDYYLNKHCMLTRDKTKTRCGGCIWRNIKIRKCIFSLDYPKQVSIDEFKKRILMVNMEQQNKLTNPNRRFVI